MSFFVAGLSYKTAPVQLREKLSVHASRLRCQGCRLKIAGGLSEVVVLSTCNRVEVYGVGEWARARAQRLFRLLVTDPTIDFTPCLYVHEGLEAVRHLFAVAGGLDSMVVGETEITGQVKQAYLAAQEARLTGKITNRLFQLALQIAKEIRTHTGIGRGAVSVGSVAVELAERIFGQEFSNRTVMIIGAGKMGEACVKHLSKKGTRSVLVANRSHERAVSLAADFGGQAVRFEDCLKAMAEVDIVVSSTGAPQTILHREDVAKVMAARRNRALFLVDIAVPRDIDTEVEQLPNVYLYNVDHLEAIVRENLRAREHEILRGQEIIAQRAAAAFARITSPPATRAGTSEQAPAWGWSQPAACAT